MSDKITEEMHLEKEWFARASKMELKDLPAFIDEMMNKYGHDYGTVCHAVAACALAAAWTTCKVAGLTGFQAGCVMWDFIHNWMYRNNECGLKIVDYDKMLYPQYEYRFEKTITPETWKNLMNKAKQKLATENNVHPAVKEHWEKIANGEIPFGYQVKEEW